MGAAPGGAPPGGSPGCRQGLLSSVGTPVQLAGAITARLARRRRQLLAVIAYDADAITDAVIGSRGVAGHSRVCTGQASTEELTVREAVPPAAAGGACVIRRAEQRSTRYVATALFTREVVPGCPTLPDGSCNLVRGR